MGNKKSMMGGLSWEVAFEGIPVGEKIRRIRKEKGLSLKHVSKDTGITQGGLSMIERGLRNPSLESLVLILMSLDHELVIQPE